MEENRPCLSAMLRAGGRLNPARFQPKRSDVSGPGSLSAAQSPKARPLAVPICCGLVGDCKLEADVFAQGVSDKLDANR